MHKPTILIAAAKILMLSTGSFAANNSLGRHALVVGIMNYVTAPLRNTVNDATAIAKKLESIGFDVTLLLDASTEELKGSVVTFYKSIRQADNKESLALFYYAGHAVQINHNNFLVPLDVSFEDNAFFMTGLFDLNDLFHRMALFANLQHVVVLDACRNNPFVGDEKSATGSIAKGLAPMRAPPGTLIAYSTEPGNVAADGAGKHGTYTKYLLRELDRRVRTEEIFRNVRKAVLKATRNKQTPWEHSSLVNDVFLNPPKNRNIPELMTF